MRMSCGVRTLASNCKLYSTDKQKTAAMRFFVDGKLKREAASELLLFAKVPVALIN